MRATIALAVCCTVGCGSTPSPSGPTGTPQLRARAAEAVPPRVELRYLTRDSVELTVHSTGAERVYVQVDTASGIRTETLPIAPGEPARFELALPDRSRVYPLRVSAAPAGQPTAATLAGAFDLSPVPGSAVLRQRLAAAARDRERLARLLVQILELRHDVYALPGRRFPTSREIANAPSQAVSSAVARARRLAVDWLRREHAIDAGLLASLLRVEATAMPLEPESACSLLGDVGRLSDIDAAGEIVAGQPVLDLSAAVFQLVRLTRDAPLPADGFRPIPVLKQGHLKGMLDDSALSLWTSARFAQSESVVTIWNDSVKRVIETLAVPDRSDPDHQRGLWYELGVIPRPFPSGPSVTIGVEAAHYSPEVCLWIRIGPNRAIPLRNAQSSFRGFMTVRGEPHETATPLVAEIPAGLVAGAGNKLYARVEAFSLVDGRPVPVPREIWLVDLVVR